jgi:peptidoglycan/LPS O-acetylase OafA/YrhL
MTSTGLARSGPSDSPIHVLTLDGVRGLAILAVLLVHLFPSTVASPHILLHAALLLRNQLWAGVSLFFSLSGFLITGILFDSLDAEHYFRTFFGRRCLRIFPLYYGLLGLLLLLTPVLRLNWQGQSYRLLTYTPNIPFFGDWVQNPSKYFNFLHFWSLAVEEQFYLLWPLLVFYLRSWRKIFIATLAGAALALAFRCTLAFAGLGPLNHTLPACMDSLLLGGCLAMLVRSRYREQVLRWGPAVFVVTAAIAIYPALTQEAYVWEQNRYLTTVGLTVIALASSSLIAACLRSGSWIQSVFQSRGLRFFGRYSYGLYVYHFSILSTVRVVADPWLKRHNATSATIIAIGGIVTFVLSVAVSVLSYELYEKHFLRLKRYFPYRRRAQVSSIPSALEPTS